MLSVSHLSAGYGPVEVLHDISLEVSPDEIVAVVGANGAGKSTLLKTIAGLITPFEGTITFDGQDITHHPAHQVVRLGLSLLPEARQLFAGLTVLDNLLLGSYGRARRPGREELSADVDSIFQRFPVLRERQRQKAGTLSGGQQQMLAIGRALMSRPRMLLFDEPSLGLAPRLVREVLAIAMELRAEMPVLLVEQNARAALAICQRAYVLDTGRVALSGTGQEVLENEALRHHYLGSKLLAV